MRVLLTTDTVGGVWTFTRELATGLLRRGHAVALVSFGRSLSASQQAWIATVEQQYRPAFRFASSESPLEWMEQNSSAFVGGERLLLRVIAEFGVDVLHSNQFCFGALPVELPKLLTAHSDVLSWAEACRPGGLETSEWLLRYRSLVCNGMAGADAVAAPTRWMRDKLLQHYPLCGKVHVVRNGRTLPSAWSNPPRRLQAVTVGRLWDEAKGLAVLEDAEPCIPIHVVGEDRFERTAVPELTTVNFLGSLEEEEVLEILRSSSIYLATSIYEPFGLAPLEAALCGCAVIARDIASLREVWGDAAKYFRSGHDLSQLLQRLVNSPSELVALRTRSMKRGLELSASSMVDQYLRLYADLAPIASRCESVAVYAG